MPRKTGKTLVRGTLILIVGNIVVKIIGALFKLPLANIIGADGMGLYNASFIVYDIFLVIATAGFPLAISKMVARSSALGNDGEALKIFTVSRRVFFVIGLACTAAMLLGAKTFSRLIGNTRAYYAMLALAPAILFVSLMSSYRGYYQGTNDMIPTTISQVVEAVCRLVVGLSFSWVLQSRGFSAEIVAMGAIVGITVGEFSSTFTLGVLHAVRTRRRRPKRVCKTSAWSIIVMMFKTSIPIGATALIISIINMFDNSVVMHRLQFIGYTEKQANTLYGCFNMAFTVFSLPITIVSALTISVFPVLSYAFACRDYHTVSRAAAASLRMAMLAATGSAAMFAALSYPLVNLLYFSRPQDAAIAAPLLMLMAPSAISISLSMLTTCILQAIDHLLLPSRSAIIGGIVCLALNWLLVGQKGIGIYATPIGIFVCFTISAALNISAIRKSSRIRISYRDLFYKPIMPAAVMAFCGMIFFNALSPHAGVIRASLLSLALSIAVYIIALFFNNSIERGDLLMLPKGEKIVGALERLRLLPKPESAPGGQRR
ncbi:MAG: polysaccharide biosynthesis protein [Clostridia bacterium]|nr:polysaccharide biosynthesis protein [Clostridia bacterium]